MRPQLSGLLLLVFTLCFTSFAIVLTLGGGPPATTIEVAIYQALRFDFDLGAAVALATVQMACCALLLLLARNRRYTDISATSYSTTESGLWRRLDKQNSRHYSGQTPAFPSRYNKRTTIRLPDNTTAFAFVLIPMLALLIRAIGPGLAAVVFAPITLKALFNTVWVALVSGVLCVSLTLDLLISSRHLDLRLGKPVYASVMQTSGLLILVIPPIVLGTGLFLLLRNVADVFSLALILVIFINALM